MPKSVRLTPELEVTLERTAASKGLPESRVIREALQQYCEAALGQQPLRERLRYAIGAIQTKGRPVRGASRRVTRSRWEGKEFVRILRARGEK